MNTKMKVFMQQLNRKQDTPYTCVAVFIHMYKCLNKEYMIYVHI
jgi:hypothetical protein